VQRLAVLAELTSARVLVDVVNGWTRKDWDTANLKMFCLGALQVPKEE